jgi:hypothetical protein
MIASRRAFLSLAVASAAACLTAFATACFGPFRRHDRREEREERRD